VDGRPRGQAVRVELNRESPHGVASEVRVTRPAACTRED
jgi:hypothetical protein